MRLISIDGGTTNTRLVLICDGAVLAGKRLSIGARDKVFGENVSYSEVLAGGIRQILEENGLREKDIDAAVISGMICSERGLYEVAHIQAPVNVGILSGAMRQMAFPEIADIPFYLVPGVKTLSDSDELCETDIMRGEETELYGIIGKMNARGDVTVVLPGSHCKVILTERDGTMSRFVTTISGELIRAAAEQTILRDGIAGVYPEKIDEKPLLEGFDYARGHGLTEALFKVRILQKFKGYSPEELYGVLCGAILSDDIRVIEAHSSSEVLIGGSEPFRSAYATLLSQRTSCVPKLIPEDVARFAVAYGAERFIKERGI